MMHSILEECIRIYYSLSKTRFTAKPNPKAKSEMMTFFEEVY